MAEQITIFLADDHPVFGDGLAAIFRSRPEYAIIGSASDGESALNGIRRLAPDIAVVDIAMPGRTGLEIVRTVTAEGSRTKFIVLTMYDDEAYFREAMEAGVLGYLLKDSIAVEILGAVARVAAGKRYLSPALSDLFLPDLRTPPEDPLAALTATERRVLKQLAQNRTSAQIAADLNVSLRTIQNHRVNIAAKLNLSGYNTLLAFALAHKQRIDSLR